MIEQIQPAFSGFVGSHRDALILITQAIRGEIPMVYRRPHKSERQFTIVSGNVFIFNENESSIKRWTDGFSWSGSRQLGNFLVYREISEGILQ
jgi:hypothetical protein